MKKLQLFALFIFINSFAQTTKIEKSDGSIISATKVEFSNFSEKLTYWIDKDKEKIDYKDLKSVSNNNYIFRYFPQGKKFKGMFVKVETKDKILAFMNYDANSTVTPLNSDGTGKPLYDLSVEGWSGKSFDHVHLTVFDKQGNVLDDVDLRQGLEQHNIEERAAAFELIKKHFSDCPTLISELDAYIKKQVDPKKILITLYFMRRDTKGYLNKYLECK